MLRRPLQAKTTPCVPLASQRGAESPTHATCGEGGHEHGASCDSHGGGHDHGGHAHGAPEKTTKPKQASGGGLGSGNLNIDAAYLHVLGDLAQV